MMLYVSARVFPAGIHLAYRLVGMPGTGPRRNARPRPRHRLACHKALALTRQAPPEEPRQSPWFPIRRLDSTMVPPVSRHGLAVRYPGALAGAITNHMHM
jgi:hypothetical protein